MPGTTKTNHELRKWAGSIVATKTNSWERAAEFLRVGIESAKKHYSGSAKPSKPLSIEDLMACGVARRKAVRTPEDRRSGIPSGAPKEPSDVRQDWKGPEPLDPMFPWRVTSVDPIQICQKITPTKTP